MADFMKSRTQFRQWVVPFAISIVNALSVLLAVLPYQRDHTISYFQPVQITLAGISFAMSLLMFCCLATINDKSTRLVVELVFYAIVFFTCTAAAIPITIRKLNDTLDSDYSDVKAKGLVIPLVVIFAWISTVTALICLIVSSFDLVRPTGSDTSSSIYDSATSFRTAKSSLRSSLRSSNRSKPSLAQNAPTSHQGDPQPTSQEKGDENKSLTKAETAV